MAKFIISLGMINKKLLFPLIYFIIYIFVHIFNLSVDYNEVSVFLDGFGFSLGEISAFFVGQIIKYKRIDTKKKKIKKKFFLDYFFLFLINVFYMLMRFSPFFFLKKDKDDDTNAYKDLLTNDALEQILTTIVTWFALKYKYYIHHIISLILIIILSIIMDLILGNFSHTNTFLVISSLLYVVGDSIMQSYFKYLMEKKYYHFTDILFTTGIFDLTLFSLSLGIILIEQKIRVSYKLIFQFYEYFKAYGTWRLTSIFLVGLILRGLILFLLELKIVDALNPNFLFLSYQIGKMPSTIMSIEGKNKWIVLVLQILQIFIGLFYLEILEYNFCSLNKNTKKNIAKREHRESINENNFDEDDEDIEIKGGYDIRQSIKEQERIKELNEMDEVLEEKENDI